MWEWMEGVGNTCRALLPASIGLLCAVNMECWIKTRLRNQTARSEQLSVQNSRAGTIVFCWTGQVCMFDSLGASVSYFCEQIFENIVCYDIKSFECKFLRQICRVWDPVVHFMKLHPARHHEVDHSKTGSDQESDASRHHPRTHRRNFIYLVWNILSNFQIVSPHFYELCDRSKYRSSNQWRERQINPEKRCEK